ncbi:MAG: DUF4190 domain-containing protein [Verrucomicrobiota bacterium]|jgi:hypothetical protein
MYKIIGSDQKIYGPASAAQIRQWQAEGRITGATLVQAEGSNEWKPLSSMPEFSIPPVVSMPPVPTVQRGSNMALAGLICGVLANVCCCFGFLCAILGIVFSVIALNQQEAHPHEGGRAMALAGLVLSVVGLIWHCLVPLTMGFPFGAWHMFHHHWGRW